jgi:hypothetical protein
MHDITWWIFVSQSYPLNIGCDLKASGDFNDLNVVRTPSIGKIFEFWKKKIREKLDFLSNQLV